MEKRRCPLSDVRLYGVYTFVIRLRESSVTEDYRLALQFLPDRLEAVIKTCMKLTSAECTVENS